MIKTGLAAIAATLTMAMSSAAIAQSGNPTAKVAVVDVQRVQQSSRAMQAIRDALQALRRKYEKEFVSSDKEMQAEYTRLRKDKEMSRGEYERRVRVLQADMVKMRRQSRARSEALSQSFQQSFAKFRQEVVLVVKSLAVEAGYTLVLNQATLIHAAPQYDITDKVVARLNKRLPKLPLRYKDPVNNKKDEVRQGRGQAQEDKK
ncbi:MAG: OmpH family outer membrane protein [Rhodospirillaceae bacterium]|nr:OmpH family outer membrane protein [Rhodospirillaceae bacterium]